MADQVIQLPYRIIAVDEDLPIRLQRNFDEIVRLLGMLQIYENKTGKVVNEQVAENSPVWDRANNITAEGKWQTSKLEGAIETLANQINAGAGNVTITDQNGIMIVDNKDAPTKALRLLGGIFGIANSKDVHGNWEWKSFGTGDGFTADLLTSGKILTSLISIVGDRYFTKLLGDGFRVYDKSGSLAGHFGYYETLADQLATFTRASVAYTSTGSQVASGVPRYEYAALPAPVWQDTFDTDQLATQYTSGGDTPATWAVADGVLTGTGGVYGTLIKNDLLLQDGEIEVTCEQAQIGGIVFRYQSNGNYYFVELFDDSGALPDVNVRLRKYVNGSRYDIVSSSNLTWPRGTAKTIKVTYHGTKIEGYFDGVKIFSVTDTAFSGGGVGLMNASSVAVRFLDFKVYYAQQAVMVEEGTTNLLTANQASVETDTTGFMTYGSATMSRDTTNYWHGNASLKVVTPGAATNEGFSTTTVSGLTASQTYTASVWLKGSGTVTLRIREMDSSGVMLGDTSSSVITLTNVWKRYSVSRTFGATGVQSQLHVRTNTPQAITFYADGLQIEQKAYATSWQLPGTARAGEVLTVPTTGVFTKGRWGVELEFTPTSTQTGQPARLWNIYISSGNEYQIIVHSNGRPYGSVRSGGTEYSNYTSSIPVMAVGNSYKISFSGDGANLFFCVNGIQYDSPKTYVEPVGTLPENMYVGSGVGMMQANGIISDFRISNRSRTLAEHQAAYNSGQPLTYDESTTYLMSCNGTLQPTVRGFGLFTKNGRIVLQDPQKGQGIEVWDGSTRKVLIGRLDDNTIGQEIVGGKLYASDIVSGAKGATTYIGLTSSGTLIAKVNGNTILRTEAGTEDGNMYFGKAAGGGDFGRILRYTDSYQGMAIESVIAGESLSLRSGGDIDAIPGGSGGSGYFFTVHGDSRNLGGTKYAVEETSEGLIGFAARESPEVRYVDEGRAELTNGECRIDLAPLFLECTIPDSDTTPWHIFLTPKGPFTLYEAEIGDTYFVVKSHESGINGKFSWQLSAVRKGYADVRFNKCDIS